MQWCQKTATYLGHAVIEGSYNMEPKLEMLRDQVTRIEGRHTLQQALRLINGLKPHNMQFANLVARFYKEVVDVGSETNWTVVNDRFHEVVMKLTKGHVSLSMQTIIGHYDLYIDWSRHAESYVLCKGGNLYLWDQLY